MTKSEMFGQEEISIIQTRQLRKAIHYAYQRSPFYRDMLDRSRINPVEIKSLEDLRNLPTTSWEDISREGERFLCVRPEEVAEIMFTTGHHGSSLELKVSEPDLARLAYHAQLSFMVAGITPKDTVGLALTLDDGAMLGISSYLGMRRLGATVIRVGHADPEKIYHQISLAKVSVLLGSADLLKQVALWAQAAGQDLAKLQVRRLLCVNEPVRNQDFTLGEKGRFLAQAWNAGIKTLYSNAVSAALLSDCDEENGSHIHPELMHVEIVGEQGQPLAEGEIGEVCVTPFGVAAMPMIRYRTGDCSFLVQKECRCGRQTPRLGPILGLVGQQISVKGTVVFPRAIHDLVEAEAGVSGHALIAEKPGSSQNDLTLLIASENQQTIDTLRNRLREQMRLEPNIQRVDRSVIASLQAGDPHRLFIDRRTP